MACSVIRVIARTDTQTAKRLERGLRQDIRIARRFSEDFIADAHRHAGKLSGLAAAVPGFFEWVVDEVERGPNYVLFCLDLLRHQDPAYQARAMMHGKRLPLLRRFSGLNITRPTYRALMKFSAGTAPSRFSDMLRKVMDAQANPRRARAIASAETLNSDLLSFIRDAPEDFLHVPLVKVLAARGSRFSVSAVLALMETCGDESLAKLHTALKRIRGSQDLDRILDRYGPKPEFPPPPFPAWGGLSPLVSQDEMRREGRKMRNCLGSLVHGGVGPECPNPAYYYRYKADGVRATVRLRRKADRNWHVVEAKGPGNAQLTRAAMQKIERTVAQAQAHLNDVASMSESAATS